ncbi:MAG: putative lipid II flippase FtsW [Oscillospiraceae bacterium]|nr:putative lipid II flippase FtsW [Oscillospiraceae bacterium]
MTVRDTRDDFQDVGDIQAEPIVEGLPNWENRELSSEYIEADQKKLGVDKPFLVLTLVILLIGVVMVLSASFARAYYTSGEPMRLFMRQLLFAVSGIALMLLVSRISVRTMSRWSTHLLIISIVMLILVLAVGIRVNGAKRWIGIGGANGSFTFQPSEIAKVAVILSFAQIMCRFGRAKMRTFKFGVLPFAAITGVIIVLLGLETHLSAVIIVVTLAVIMMFAGGTKLRWFLLAGAVALAILGLLVLMSLRTSSPQEGVQSPTEQLSKIKWGDRFGYAGRRIDAWLNPDADPLNDGFQIRQSLLAVGSGGLMGQGLGQSRQKYLYLPEEHNDYIFAIVCEEMGFIGAMLILMLFALLIVRGFWLALHAKDKYSSLITTGITSLLAIQVFLNVAVVTNILPATGISLPFFSYGGTALWIQLVQMGIILAVSREIPLTKAETRDIE